MGYLKIYSVSQPGVMPTSQSMTSDLTLFLAFSDFWKHLYGHPVVEYCPPLFLQTPPVHLSRILMSLIKGFSPWKTWETQQYIFPGPVNCHQRSKHHPYSWSQCCPKVEPSVTMLNMSEAELTPCANTFSLYLPEGVAMTSRSKLASPTGHWYHVNDANISGGTFYLP